MLQRELDRAWSSLKMEEHLNRNLPPMVSAKTEKEFDILKENGVRRIMDFLSEHEIMHIKDIMEDKLHYSITVSYTHLTLPTNREV